MLEKKEMSLYVKAMAAMAKAFDMAVFDMAAFR